MMAGLMSGILHRVFHPTRFASCLAGIKLVLAALLLAGFGPAANGAELMRLRISIPGLGSSSYPLIMAQKKGYFRAEGYDVELIPMAGGLAVKTLMAGEVNLTSAGTVVAIIQGAKLRLVMGFIRHLPYDLVAAPEIKRVEDLRGKKVAVADRGSVTFMVARAILQAHGLELDKDVTILATRCSLSGAHDGKCTSGSGKLRWDGNAGAEGISFCGKGGEVRQRICRLAVSYSGAVGKAAG